MRAELSLDPVASLVPLAFHATDMTARPCSRRCSSAPLARSKMRADLSDDPVASFVPLAFHATEKTKSPCSNRCSSDNYQTHNNISLFAR